MTYDANRFTAGWHGKEGDMAKGAILIVDGTGTVTADISSFDLHDYQVAIDAALEP